MKLPLRLGLALLVLLVIGGGTPQTSESVIVKDKGDAKSTAAAATAKTPAPALVASTPPRSGAMCGAPPSECCHTWGYCPSPSFLLT
jgi:hypothetical protein